MAYDARGNELLKAFDQMQTRLQPIELLRCLPIVKDLVADRSRLLDAMVAVLEPEGFDPIAAEFAAKQQAVWDRFVQPLSRLLDGLSEPTLELDHWRELAVTSETRFFRSLQELKLGETYDEMAVLHATLQEMIGALDRKWATMSEEAQRLERLELEACAKMTEIVSQSLSQATDAWARYSDTLKELLESCMKVPDLVNQAVVYLAMEAGVPENVAKLIPTISMLGKDPFALAKDYGIPAGDFAKAEPWLSRDPGMAVSETIQKAIGPEFEAFVTAVNALSKYVLPIASGTYYEQVGALQRLLPNHGSILVSLSQTRKDVDDFLQNNGMDRLRQVYDRATYALDQWASGASSDGQRSDAEELRRAMKEAFSKRFERMTHEFEEFVRANQGRFLGTVDHATAEQLLWEDIWVDREQGIAHLGLDDRLREWRAGTLEVRGTFDTASSQLFEKLRVLPPELHDRIASALNAYWDKLRAQLKQGTEQTASTLANAETRVSDDQIKRDLDRSDLARQLRA